MHKALLCNCASVTPSLDIACGFGFSITEEHDRTRKDAKEGVRGVPSQGPANAIWALQSKGMTRT